MLQAENPLSKIKPCPVLEDQFFFFFQPNFSLGTTKKYLEGILK